MKATDDGARELIHAIYDGVTSGRTGVKSPLHLLKKNLGKTLDMLDKKEKRVLELRFGLHDGNMLNLKEVGKIFNVTDSRISQIQACGLRRLRHPLRLEVLEGRRE